MHNFSHEQIVSDKEDNIDFARAKNPVCLSRFVEIYTLVKVYDGVVRIGIFLIDIFVGNN